MDGDTLPLVSLRRGEEEEEKEARAFNPDWLRESSGRLMRADGAFQLRMMFQSWLKHSGPVDTVYAFGVEEQLEEYLENRPDGKDLCFDALRFCCRNGYKCVNGKHLGVFDTLEILHKSSLRTTDSAKDKQVYDSIGGAVCRRFEAHRINKDDRGCPKTTYLAGCDALGCRSGFHPEKACPYFHFSVAEHVELHPSFWNLCNGGLPPEDRFVAPPDVNIKILSRRSHRCECECSHIESFPYAYLRELNIFPLSNGD